MRDGCNVDDLHRTLDKTNRAGTLALAGLELGFVAVRDRSSHLDPDISTFTYRRILSARRAQILVRL